MFGIKNMLIAAGIAFVIGGVLGWRIESKFCRAAELEKQVNSLNAQIAARDAAAKQDAIKVQESEEQINALQERINNAEASASKSQCLGPDDTRRLRSLWK